MPGLFDLPDPFATMRRQMMPRSPFAAARMGQGAMQGQQPTIPDVELDDATRESMLRSMTRKTLGGVSAAANVLDVPGSVVRDIAGLATTGNFSKYNPLDQLLPWNWTSSEGRATGRDLGREWGWMKPQDTWGNLAGGIGLEIGMDPLSWLSGGMYGAATKGGKLAKMAGVGIDDIVKVAAKKAGVESANVGKRWAARTVKARDLLDPQLADQKIIDKVTGAMQRTNTLPVQVLDDPLRSAFGISVPFTSKTIGNIGLGTPGTGLVSQAAKKLGMDLTTKTPLDVISDAARWSTPGRMAASLMHKPALGRMTQEGQQLAGRVFGRRTTKEADIRGEVMELAEYLRENDMLDADAGKWIRAQAEGVDPATLPNIPNYTTAQTDVLRNVATKMRTIDDRILQQKLASGLDAHVLSDMVDETTQQALEHLFRQPGMDIERSGYLAKVFKGKSAEDIARMDLFKGFRLGTAGVEEIVTDANLDRLIEQQLAMLPAGQPRTPVFQAVEQYIANNYGNRILPGWVDDAQKQHNRYNELAKWLVENPARRSGEGRGLFTNHVLADFNRYRHVQELRLETFDELGNYLAEAATDPNILDNGVKVKSLLEELKGVNVNKTDINGSPARPYLDILFEKRFGRRSATQQGWEAMGEMEIPADVANDLKGLFPGYSAPEATKWFANIWDSMNSLFKVGVLTWPARYFRDVISGQARNMEAGAWDLVSAIEADRLLRGQTVSGAKSLPIIQERVMQKLRERGVANPTASDVTDALATRELRIMYGQYGPGSHNIATDTLGPSAGAPYERNIEQVIGQMPRRDPVTQLGWLSELGSEFAGRGKQGKTLKKFWKVRGVGDMETTEWGPAAAGDVIGRRSDDMNRLVPFLHKLKQGYDPEAAMKEVNFMQVDYNPSTFTPTERQLKRLIPFYSFLVKNAKYVGHELATRPGGAMAQQIKLAADLKDDRRPLPEYVANTLAIPLPGGKEGNLKFLTGLGAMWEGPLQFMGGGARGGLLEGISQLAPGFQFPLSWATGQSFFQTTPYGGRLLEDTDPTMARTIANVSDLFTGKKTERVEPLGGQFTESLAMASPLSRALTTARTISDIKRKGLLGVLSNVLTGFRVSDVSPAAQVAMAREALQHDDMGRTYTNWWLPVEDYLQMSPLDQARARVKKAMNKSIQEYSKATKEGKPAEFPLL